NIPLFYVKNFEATDKFGTKELKVLGFRGVQTKVTGVTGEFKCTIYKVTSDFIKIASDYRRTGRLPEVSITVTNEDPASTIGRQQTQYTGVVFTEIPTGKISVEEEFLEEDLSGAYADFTIIEPFKQIQD